MAVIGFPHLLVCMGVVGVVEGCLYGIHLTETDATDELIDAFRGWIQGTYGVKGSDMRALYGSAVLPNRYGHNTPNLEGKWKAEMSGIAQRLGYRGPVYGFDGSAIVPKDGFYAEYRANYPTGTCRIFYKRNDKMLYWPSHANNHTAQVKLSEQIPEKRYKDGRYLPPSTIPGSIIASLNSVGGAKVDPDKSKSAALSEVDYSTRLMQFFQI
jgi:hypothetical protein